MSKFLYHEPCPKCGSRDNLGVWNDGHKYCFGCGHHVPPPGRIFVPEIPHAPSARVELPEDVSMLFPQHVDDWITRYITIREAMENNFLWSGSNQLLIMPVVGEDKDILMWQGRSFDPTRPKYVTKGSSKDVLDLHCKNVASEMVVLVEDKLSAIKVGRHFNTICLYGSVIHEDIIPRIYKRFKVLTIWLDWDKMKEAYEYQMDFSPFFDEINVINSRQDPKAYDNHEILKKVNEG